MQPIIRFATPEDAAGVLEIYAPYVTSTSVTFEVTVPRVYDFKRRIASIASSMPYLVCEIDGHIAGFAYASVFRPLAAYNWNASLSVYIGSKYQRCNMASALYLAVISLLKAQGYRKVIAVVTSANAVSEQFHSAFGFTKAGTLEKAGFKGGKWYSVSLFEKTLDDSDTVPKSTVPVTSLDEDFCRRNLSQCAKIIKWRG